MNKLKLTRFKAFEGEVTFPLDNKKNLLLYGENGSGKSSIYEAIKIIFFKTKLESRLSAQTPEDLQQKKDELWSSFNNKITNQDFEITVNDLSHNSFQIENYQVFMISIEELSVENKINLKSLLSKFYFFISDVDVLCEGHHEQLQTSVNAALADFKETISIEIDEEDDFTIKIIDSQRKLERSLDIKRYFNEAKLNLVVLLILLNAIELSKDSLKSKILVLDDFITSLDTSNRTFIIRYVFQKFQDTQILILTHNISFYNLIMYLINDVAGDSSRWTFCNLFEINNSHKIYIKSEIERIHNIKNDFAQLALPAAAVDIENIGNRIRKKFEILLYEYSKLVMIGTVEDSKKILERITQGKAVYFDKNKTASDLIDVIQQILLEANPNNLTDRLQQKIEMFKKEDFENFKKILKELKLYQKVTMHPMSHGISGLSTFTVKEIKQSIELLEKMEAYLKDLVNDNVVAV